MSAVASVPAVGEVCHDAGISAIAGVSGVVDVFAVAEVLFVAGVQQLLAGLLLLC